MMLLHLLMWLHVALLRHTCRSLSDPAPMTPPSRAIDERGRERASLAQGAGTTMMMMMKRRSRPVPLVDLQAHLRPYNRAIMWCNMLTRSLLALGLCASAASAASYDQHYQVFLYPSPSNSHADAANTLTADQARSVFDHHLGNSYGGSDRKSRVVFVKGDVDVQGE